MRVAVQLIDTATEQTLWSEQYHRTLAGVLSVQSDVALRIAEALNATLSSDERRRSKRFLLRTPKPIGHIYDRWS